VVVVVAGGEVLENRRRKLKSLNIYLIHPGKMTERQRDETMWFLGVKAKGGMERWKLMESNRNKY
jgi:hypothetical protein